MLVHARIWGFWCAMDAFFLRAAYGLLDGFYIVLYKNQLVKYALVWCLLVGGVFIFVPE